MITKSQIKELPPNQWEVCQSYVRFKNGAIVPESHPAYRTPKFKKTWFGGKYVIKVERGYYPVPKRKYSGK